MNRDPVVIEEGYAPGCIGRIVELHGTYYAEHEGFGVYFESKVGRELGEFCSRYTKGRDGLWLARRDGRVEGSIVIDGIDPAAARLRWFIVSDALRGTGAGTRLLRPALDFCRSCRYPRVHLLTFSSLSAARHLYEKYGFRLVSEERGSQWGKEVIEQRYELLL